MSILCYKIILSSTLICFSLFSCLSANLQSNFEKPGSHNLPLCYFFVYFQCISIAVSELLTCIFHKTDFSNYSIVLTFSSMAFVLTNSTHFQTCSRAASIPPISLVRLFYAFLIQLDFLVTFVFHPATSYLLNDFLNFIP